AIGVLSATHAPVECCVFITPRYRFHTITITQHPSQQAASHPQRGQLGLVHIVFKVGSYAALREAYAHLLDHGVEIQRATDHVCQRSVYFNDPDGNGLEIYYEMPRALELFPNGRGDEDEALPLSRRDDPLPQWLTEDWPGPAAMAKVDRLRQQTSAAE